MIPSGDRAVTSKYRGKEARLRAIRGTKSGTEMGGTLTNEAEISSA